MYSCTTVSKRIDEDDDEIIEISEECEDLLKEINELCFHVQMTNKISLEREYLFSKFFESISLLDDGKMGIEIDKLMYNLEKTNDIYETLLLFLKL